MTNPIRPSGPAPLGGGSALDELDARERAGATPSGIAGAAQSGATSSADATSAQAGAHATSAQSADAARLASASHAESPAASVLHRLEAGQITRAEAVDALVAQALQKHAAHRLAPAQRDDLSAVLRSALIDDPVLGKLLR